MPKDLSREQKNNNPENQRPTWQNPSILRLGGNSRTWEPRATSKTRSEFVAENRWVKNSFQCSLHPPPNPTIENFPTTQTAIMKLTKKQKIPPKKKLPLPGLSHSGALAGAVQTPARAAHDHNASVRKVGSETDPKGSGARDVEGFPTVPRKDSHPKSRLKDLRGEQYGGE